jgi:predicted transcriptional regulator
MTEKSDTARPVTVRLTAKEVKSLDALAAASNMTRHRYMSCVLERAMKSGLVVKETVEYTETGAKHPALG